MPSKKKKYNARFPPARIKKIMQTDEDVGKVAAAVPVIISRALEKFIETLIVKSSEITQSRNAKTLTTSHIKQTVNNEKKFDFLKDLMATVPDHQTEEDSEKSSTSGESKKTKVSRPRKQLEHKKKKRKRATSDSSEEHEEGENANEEEIEDDSETETDNEGESQEGTSVQNSPYSAGPSSSVLPISNIQASSSHVTHSSQSDEGKMPQLSHPAMMMSQATRMANPTLPLHGPYPPPMGAMPLSMPQQGVDGLRPVGSVVQDSMQFKNNLVQHGPQIGLCNKVGPYPPGMFPPSEFSYPGPLPHLIGGQATYQSPSMFTTQNTGLPFHNNGMQRNDSFSRGIDSNCSKEPENLCSKDSNSKMPVVQEPIALNLSMGVRKAVSETAEDDDYDT